VAFDYQPTLQDASVELRPLQATDYDALYTVAADPLVWEQHPDKTRSQPAGFQVFFQQALASGGALLAKDAASRRVIGSSRFHGYDQSQDEVEIGWTFLARSHWGGRYNGAMKQLMLDHAFRFVSRVVFVIDPSNHRSQRAVEKLGGSGSGPGETQVVAIATCSRLPHPPGPSEGLEAPVVRADPFAAQPAHVARRLPGA
jgi:RimJ/RimL family protein N-acetyltransferase